MVTDERTNPSPLAVNIDIYVIKLFYVLHKDIAVKKLISLVEHYVSHHVVRSIKGNENKQL